MKNKSEKATTKIRNSGNPEFFKRFSAACAANGTNLTQWAKNHGIAQSCIWQYAIGRRASKKHYPLMVAFVEKYENSIRSKKAA